MRNFFGKIVKPEPVILVVEDDQSFRQVLANYLQLSGFKVLTAEDGIEALKILKNGALPQIILSDLSMPNMNGYRLVATLRTDPTLAQIPVILCSSEYFVADIAAGLGVAGFVPKNASKEHILNTVKAVLKK